MNPSTSNYSMFSSLFSWTRLLSTVAISSSLSLFAHRTHSNINQVFAFYVDCLCFVGIEACFELQFCDTKTITRNKK